MSEVVAADGENMVWSPVGTRVECVDIGADGSCEWQAKISL